MACLLIGVIDAFGYGFSNRAKKTIAAPPKHEIKKILLCRNDHMGDVLMLTPVIRAVRDQLPDAKVHVLINSISKPWVGHISGIEKYHFFDHFYLNRKDKSLIKRLIVMLRQIPRLIKDIKVEKYDIAIDLRPHFGNVIPLLRASNIKFMAGYGSSGFGFLLDKKIEFDQTKHFVENMFKCVSCICGEIDAGRYNMTIDSGSSKDDEIDALLKKYDLSKDRGYIAVHPFSGNDCKMWTAEKWAALINKIGQERGREVVILGSKADRRYFANIDRLVTVKIADLIGQTDFSQLIKIIEWSRLFIGVDSLSAHIAAALSKKVVTVSTGIQDEVLWKPWLFEGSIVSSKMNCSPCYKAKGCRHMRCIRNVEVSSVYAEVSKYLN